MEVRELETNFGYSPDFARKLRKSKTACLWIQPTKRLLSNKKDENFGEWYSEVVVRGEMIKDHDILDCYSLLSRTMCIWNTMKVFEILDLYRRIYEEYLAVPVVKGFKSELKKFAGALYTTTVEACIPNTGCSIQGATSNCLGQLIDFENEKGENSMVWHNFWAYSTQTIGVMVMVHGDGRGLVLPPKVAPLQAIVIPLHYKDFDIQAIFDACNETVVTLTGAGLRVEADLRDNYSPGWKYSHWEMKGVPLRIEIGPKELVNNQVRFVCCDNFKKVDIPRNDLVNQVEDMLAKIQESMFDVAKVKQDACVKVAITWKEFMEALNQKKIIFAPWCDEKEVEEDVITRTKGETGAAKSPCSPLNQPELPEGTLCFASEKPAKKWTYWGRSY